jgi:hypothetical protein
MPSPLPDPLRQMSRFVAEAISVALETKITGM